MMCNLVDYCYSSPDFSISAQSFIPLTWNEGISSIIQRLVKELIEKNPWVDVSKTSLILGSSLFNIDGVIIGTEKRPQQLVDDIANMFHFSNMRFCVSNTCVTGFDAISLAKQLLKKAMSTYCIVVLFDYASDFIRKGFTSLNILGDSAKLEIYHEDCNGAVFATAAAACLFTNESSKTAARVIDAYTINDAYALSTVTPENVGLQKVIKLLLERNRCSIHSITGILCSANGILANDLCYLVLLQKLGYTGMVSSVKNVTKHSLGATALVELCVFLDLLLSHQFTIKCFKYQLDSMQRPLVSSIDQLIRKGTFLLLGSGFGGVTGGLLFEV